MKYIKGLDTVRAFAVCLVIIWHWYPQYPLYTFAGFIQHLFIPTGEFAVNLFFVLSGYLISGILLKAKDSSNNNLLIIKKFIIRRSLRIFPIYYLVVGLMVLDNFPFQSGFLPYILTYTVNFLVINEGAWNNFSHTWSLSVEEQFYLLWPWLILYIRRSYQKYLFPFFIIFAILSLTFCIGVMHLKLAGVFPFCCFDAFGIGGLYAYCQMDENRYLQFKKMIKIVVPVAVCIYFIWKLCPYFGLFPKLSFYERTIDSVISIWLIHLVITNKSEWVKKNILENRLLNTIGKISYGLYLFHYPYPYFFYQFTGFIGKEFQSTRIIFNNGFIFQFLMVITLFILAFLSFHLFEKRIVNLKHKFSYLDSKELNKMNL